MKTYLIKMALLLMPSLMLAQFSVQSDFSFDYGHDPAITDIDSIVVFEIIDSSATLNYVFADSTSSEWHYHTSIKDSLISSTVTRDTLTTLDSLQQGLYELRLDATLSYYFSVVDFSEYQPMVDSVWVEDSGDSCNTVRLNASLLRQDIPVYDQLNDTTHLLLEPTTTYLWSNDTLENQSLSPSSLDAPFENVSYACTPYSDDFFASNEIAVLYSDPDTSYTDLYTAIAVSMGTFEATIPDDDGNSNTSVSSSTTVGSAPLDVTYTVSPKGNTTSYWWVWNIDNDKPTVATYRYQDQITHSFRTYAPSGYRVQVEVRNEQCQVIDSMEVMVTESNLKVPNILILGFGAEGKFKVAYQSIDPSSFKAAVYDRNGRLMYKWEDPTGGWDGRSPVTGAYVSPGAYYYSIQARGTDGIKYELMGDVNVIREKGIK
ncbi:MAG: hypothetical protein PF444_00895 [Bacteroidales bacterium]|jgi:hypothetical protein|nr:hypothetical protein [Bacteroidales bacterium]